jgi:hypothetical protein
MRLSRKRKDRRRNSASGASITEYASAIAFVAVIVLLVFSVGRGQMVSTISYAYGTCDAALDNEATTVNNAGNGATLP